MVRQFRAFGRRQHDIADRAVDGHIRVYTGMLSHHASSRFALSEL